mgnify:CR=1 FL=1
MAPITYLGLLALVFVMCCVGSWASYTKFKETRLYLPLLVTLGGVCSLLFGLAAKWLKSNEKLYVFSLYFDALMAFAYYLLPLLVFGTKLSPGVLVGAALVVAGLFVVHIYG